MLAKARKQSTLQKHVILDFPVQVRAQDQKHRPQDSLFENKTNTQSEKTIHENPKMKLKLICTPRKYCLRNNFKWGKYWVKKSFFSQQKKSDGSTSLIHNKSSSEAYACKRQLIKPKKPNLTTTSLRPITCKLSIDQAAEEQNKKMWGYIAYKSEKKLVQRLLQRCIVAKQVTSIVQQSKNYYQKLSEDILDRTSHKFRLKKYPSTARRH